MDDESLVRLFEAGEMPPNGFHHPDHVRVAWWYLTQHQLPEALSRFTTALRRFAVAQGKPQLFHETITTAYMLLINERLDGSRARPRVGHVRRPAIRICCRGGPRCSIAITTRRHSRRTARVGRS